MRIRALFKSVRTFANTILVEWMGGAIFNGPNLNVLQTLTYSAAPVIDASLGSNFVMTISDAVAFVFGAPTNTPPTGFSQIITIQIRNGSGGAHGAGTFNAVFKTSAAVPAIADTKNRTFAFQWNGTNWVEIWRTAADVSN